MLYHIIDEKIKSKIVIMLIVIITQGDSKVADFCRVPRANTIKTVGRHGPVYCLSAICLRNKIVCQTDD